MVVALSPPSRRAVELIGRTAIIAVTTTSLEGTLRVGTLRTEGLITTSVRVAILRAYGPRIDGLGRTTVGIVRAALLLSRSATKVRIVRRIGSGGTSIAT